MSFLLLIVEPVGQRRERGEAEGRAVFQRMVEFGDGLRAQGRLAAVQSLASLDEAARVQRRGGASQVLDGPYAEAKEMVGGFFLLAGDVTRDEAIEIAGRCPAAEWATIEVRRLAPCFE